MDGDARGCDLGDQFGIPLRCIADFNQANHVDTARLRQQSGFEREIMRAQDQNALSGKCLITGKQHLKRRRAHDAGLVPTGERHRQIARAGRKDNFIKTDQP